MSALSASPFLLFYRFLWRTNRPLLARTFVFNYVAPIVLELLPWWLNRRKVGNKLRSTRIKLNHNMVTAEPYKCALCGRCVSLMAAQAVTRGRLCDARPPLCLARDHVQVAGGAVC